MPESKNFFVLGKGNSISKINYRNDSIRINTNLLSVQRHLVKHKELLFEEETDESILSLLQSSLEHCKEKLIYGGGFLCASLAKIQWQYAEFRKKTEIFLWSSLDLSNGIFTLILIIDFLAAEVKVTANVTNFVRKNSWNFLAIFSLRMQNKKRTENEEEIQTLYIFTFRWILYLGWWEIMLKVSRTIRDIKILENVQRHQKYTYSR